MTDLYRRRASEVVPTLAMVAAVAAAIGGLIACRAVPAAGDVAQVVCVEVDAAESRNYRVQGTQVLDGETVSSAVLDVYVLGRNFHEIATLDGGRTVETIRVDGIVYYRANMDPWRSYENRLPLNTLYTSDSTCPELTNLTRVGEVTLDDGTAAVHYRSPDPNQYPAGIAKSSSLTRSVTTMESAEFWVDNTGRLIQAKSVATSPVVGGVRQGTHTTVVRFLGTGDGHAIQAPVTPTPIPTP